MRGNDCDRGEADDTDSHTLWRQLELTNCLSILWVTSYMTRAARFQGSHLSTRNGGTVVGWCVTVTELQVSTVEETATV